mmetsp:Transcript_5909/g.22472  ORF Transcript_5909/g.22472 Transcript_5909/m.22472 type:complete len:236 (-) Transcript_5909:377-1084(-)
MPWIGACGGLRCPRPRARGPWRWGQSRLGPPPRAALSPSPRASALAATSPSPSPPSTTPTTTAAAPRWRRDCRRGGRRRRRCSAPWGSARVRGCRREPGSRAVRRTPTARGGRSTTSVASSLPHRPRLRRRSAVACRRRRRARRRLRGCAYRWPALRTTRFLGTMRASWKRSSRARPSCSSRPAAAAVAAVCAAPSSLGASSWAARARGRRGILMPLRMHHCLGRGPRTAPGLGT